MTTHTRLVHTSLLGKKVGAMFATKTSSSVNVRSVIPVSNRGFDQEIRWRVPATTIRWRGKAEAVMSVADPKGDAEPKIDIRIRRTVEHPKGEGFTREGLRLSLEDADSLAKAIQHTLQKLRETDVTG